MTRHLSLRLLAMGFVEHTQRLLGEKPGVTLEQVCRTVRALSQSWLARQRQQ